MVDTGARSGSDEDEDGDDDRQSDDEEADDDVDSDGEAESSGETSVSALQRGPAEGRERKRRRPVWTDEASANLVVALTGEKARAVDGSRIGTSRLRRLRETADEREIDGAEYEKRLRRM